MWGVTWNGSIGENNRDKLHICISLTNNFKEKMLRVKILFISKRMGEIGGLIRAKVRWPDGKMSCKVNKGLYFGDLCNGWGDMVEWFRGGGGMFPIFQKYPLNYLIMNTQLSVDLGLDFLLCEFLSYMFTLIYTALVIYSL